MKLGAVALSVVFTIISINPVVASGRHGHHYNNHHRSHYAYGYRGHRSHYSYGHRGHYGHYSYGHRGHYSHYGHHGHYADYVIGGLIVGGIIASAISHSYNNGTRYPAYRASAYVNPYPTNNAIKPSYIVQHDGSCYLISHVNNGNLVLSPASTRNCE